MPAWRGFLQVFQLSLLLIELVLHLAQPVHLLRLVAVKRHAVVGVDVRQMHCRPEVVCPHPQICHSNFLLQNSFSPLGCGSPFTGALLRCLLIRNPFG